jgi:hypothetical protein
MKSVAMTSYVKVRIMIQAAIAMWKKRPPSAVGLPDYPGSRVEKGGFFSRPLYFNCFLLVPDCTRQDLIEFYNREINRSDWIPKNTGDCPDLEEEDQFDLQFRSRENPAKLLNIVVMNSTMSPLEMSVMIVITKS